jgi:hypothetical protein
MVIAGLEWAKAFLDLPPVPKTLSIVALVTVVVAIVRFRLEMRRVRNFRLGSEGERIAAEALQMLVSDGWRVFHDIPAGNFNLDHVAIGPKGVLAIETKTRSKHVGRADQIVVDDDGIAIAGRSPDKNTIEQAERQAHWLETVLRERTGQRFAVRPVILFPGWFIHERRRVKEPWILEPKALPKWLAREKTVLQPADINLAGSHLDRYLREPNRPS